MLEVARFLCPRQHFGVVDNDCVPVTLFEMPDLVALATSQLKWTDLVGLAPKKTTRLQTKPAPEDPNNQCGQGFALY